MYDIVNMRLFSDAHLIPHVGLDKDFKGGDEQSEVGIDAIHLIFTISPPLRLSCFNVVVHRRIVVGVWHALQAICAREQEAHQPQRPVVVYCRVAGPRVIKAQACRLFRNITLPDREHASPTA
jgi:hypothetical protein